MFRKTKTASQLNLFTSTQSQLSGKAKRIYEDDKEWHNQFRERILEMIDEEIFRPLFIEDFGAPNSSIRVLVCMMILKEAHGCSDSYLFDNCMFHALFRSALGLHNSDDPIPVQSTYYLFRKKIVEWEKAGNGNLLEKVFTQVTKSQIAEFSINGNKVRMDSKLLGSNIAWLNRYELVHETLRVACKSINVPFAKFLTASELDVLKEISTETCSSVSYRSTNTQLESKLIQLGIIISKLLTFVSTDVTEPIEVLRKVFHQHYEVVNSEVILLPYEKLTSARIESPHDPECHYHKKADQKQKGYSINITETCNPENTVNLTTSVIVEPASVHDNKFMIPALEHTQEMLPQKIETLNADGAYHSIPNHDYCSEKEIDFVLSAIGGTNSRLELSIDADGNLICLDTETGTLLPTRKVVTKSENAPLKWVAYFPDRKNPRYLTQHDVDICLLRKQIANRSKEELNLRSNVEATIFQLGYHYRANKSRYRGLIKHRMWANIRCMWINFVRIRKYIASLEPNCANTCQNCVQIVNKCVFFAQNIVINAIYALEKIYMRLINISLPNFA